MSPNNDDLRGVQTSSSLTSTTASESNTNDFPFFSQSLNTRTRIAFLSNFGNLWVEEYMINLIDGYHKGSVKTS